MSRLPRLPVAGPDYSATLPVLGKERDLALFYDFAGASLPAAFSGIERTGLATEWQADGTLGWGDHNYQLWSEDFSNAAWTKRGTCTVTTNQIANPVDGSVTADLVEGVDVSTNDIFDSVSVSTSVSRVSPSFYLKKVSASGVLSVVNPQGAGYGDWLLDLSLVGDDWERITSEHAAVTVSTVFTHNSGNAGILWRKFSGTGTLSFYLWGAQTNSGPVALTYVVTTTAARYLVRQELHPLLSSSGVLGEPQATNQATYSRDITQWTANEITVGASTTSPDGTANMRLMVPSTNTAQHYATVGGTGILAASTYVVSFFAKLHTSGYHAKLAGCGLGANTEAVVFDVENGVMYAPGTTTYYKEGGIKDVGGGIYRCWARIVAANTTGVQPGVTNSTSDHAAATWAGDGTSGVYIWQVDVVKDASYPTAPIPTGSTTVTRTADPRLTYALNAALGAALETEGTLYVEFAFTGAGSAANSNNRNILTLSDGTTTNRIRIYNNATYVGVNAVSATTATTLNTGATVDAYEIVRLAFSWNASASSLTVNGSSSGGGTFLGCPVSQLDLLGIQSGTATAGAIIKDARVLTRYMDDAQREALAHA